MGMKQRLLITGICGFIGYNAYLKFRSDYIIEGIDSLTRDESHRKFKANKIKTKVHVVNVSQRDEVAKIIDEFRPDYILHLAAQVAVTDSIEWPHRDFEWNALGTLNVLDAMRLYVPDCKIIYASTNKVVDEKTGEFAPKTPYGVSKATGDLYCQEYARTYDMKTVILRQSCIYGIHQDAELIDQGWVAHIAGRHIKNEEITIFGDGTQVRDLLYIDDLLEAYSLFLVSDYTGIYNIGGGSTRSISLNGMIELLNSLTKNTPPITYEDWRLHDQKVYISDIEDILMLGWKPKVKVEDGVRMMVSYLQESMQ